MSQGRPSYEDLEALVVEQAALIAELRVEVAELKRRLAQNSRNPKRGFLKYTGVKINRGAGI
ncbi:MAG TPA: hypothetical protein VIC06_14935 [Solirubrobacteraceae bacterium]